MASLVLRRKIWYVTYRVNGQPRRHSTGCPEHDRIGAEIELREHHLAAVHAGTRTRPKTPTRSLLETVDAYWRYQRSRQMTEKQADGNRMRIRRLLAIMEAIDVSQITEAATQAALASLRRTPMSPRRKAEEMPLVSPRTRNTYLKSLLSLLNWGLRNKFITHNPLAGMTCENEQVDVRHARTAYTDDEFRGLYQAALTSNRAIEGVDGPTRALAYFIAAATGLRRSELASVSPNSFDLDGEHPVVKIRAAHSKRRRQDTLPLPSQLVGHLKVAFRDIQADALVFPGLEKRKTHVMIQKDLAATGIDYRNADGEFRDWHALRHSYITRAWKSGAAPHVVKELARHSDFRTTLAYSHTSSEELRAAVEAVPRLPI